MNHATRQRVLDLLVAEHYARALAAGHVIRNVAGWKDADRRACERQAAEHPTWLQDQCDRLLGEVKRAGPVATCPACGITFNPAEPDAEAAPIERAAPLHPRYTNGHVIVAAPAHLVAEYRQRGYAPLAPADAAALAAHPTPYADRPVRGADGLLYCRPACERGDPAVTLDEWLAANPEAAGPGRFLRRYVVETAEGERLADLAPLAPVDTRNATADR